MSSPISTPGHTSHADPSISQSPKQDGSPIRVEPLVSSQQHQDISSDFSDDLENPPISNSMGERAQSILELSISNTATRMKSHSTPAAEKAALLEGLEGHGLIDDGGETPPIADDSKGTDYIDDLSPSPATGVTTSAGIESLASSISSDERVTGVQKRSSTLPIEPWHAAPGSIIVEGSKHPQNALFGVFNRGRKSSLSSGTDALKKLLPKGLPSISQVGNLLGSISGKTSPTSPKPPESSSTTHSGSTSPSHDFVHSNSSGVITSGQIVPTLGDASQRPKPLRRVTSDNSMLYSTLSTSSSLGDDDRFVNHREQVNSRVKAIRDSLQDRSSFRLPQLPSMPRVPNFNFSANILTANSTALRWNSYTESLPEIIPAVPAPKNAPELHSHDSLDMKGPAVPQAASDTVRSVTDGSAAKHLDRAMDSLTGDVVVMGGYRGSILRSTADHRQVWVPVKVGLNIRRVNLEVGLEPEDEERMEETIFASGMLQNIGPVDISKRLFKRLRQCENARAGKLRVWDFGYDWRLSPHLLSRKLMNFLEKLPSNHVREDGSREGALIIAHSLGGLLTRHLVNARPELFSGIVYAGVPHSCVNILGPMRNGDAVLLSTRVLTAQVNFTLRTSFLLLPEDGRCFVDANSKEEYPVDFFNAEDWIRYRWSPCTDAALPSPQPLSPLGNLLNKSGSLLNLPLPIPGKKHVSSQSPPKSPMHVRDDANRGTEDVAASKTSRAADVIQQASSAGDGNFEPQMNTSSDPIQLPHSIQTVITIPRDKAIAYLRRTLADTKKFKQELHCKPELSASNRYPPMATIYGKSIPTCNGAKVNGRESIAHADAYDKLAFASGDGVVLAKEAMLPEGYQAVFGGRIRSDRGHISLLGDLNAVGRALEAVMKGRAKGIGKGFTIKDSQ